MNVAHYLALNTSDKLFLCVPPLPSKSTAKKIWPLETLLITHSSLARTGDNKASPRRIVFFRDDLPEGEYTGIGKEELGDIKGE